MLKLTRFLSFFFLLSGVFFVMGCAGDEPMPTPKAVISLTETPTQTPPPSATFTMRATETAVSTATPSVTPTNIPTETLPPTPSLPSASVLFVRDGTLQQWIPQTNETKVLTEGIYSWARYADDTVMFLREITPEEEYDLIAFDISTKTEFAIKRLYSKQSYTLDKIVFSPPSPLSISISPDHKWIAFAIFDGNQNKISLIVYRLLIDSQGVELSSPVLKPNLNNVFEAHEIHISWPKEDHISWRDQDGIWMANLDDISEMPIITIQPSTNTFPGPVCPEDVDPCLWGSRYLPAGWSPDGRYSLILDYRYEEGVWNVIEADTNRAFEFVDSYSGVGGDSFQWIDSETIMQLNSKRQLRIWRINPEEEPFVSLENEYQLSSDIGSDFYGIVMMPNNHVRFSASALSGPPANAFYDVDLNTGKLLKLSPDVSQREVAIAWSPDKQHVLSRETFINDSMYLFDLNGSQPIDVKLIFGSDSCCWFWYEGE